MTIQKLIQFTKAFEREWNKRFQLPTTNSTTKDEQSKSRKIMAKQPPRLDLDPDQPILNQLEDLALAGDEEAQRQLNEIISSPERLQLLSSLRLPNPKSQ